MSLLTENINWPVGVELKVQIDFLVATAKWPSPTRPWFSFPDSGLLPGRGSCIPEPPLSFRYFPPEIPLDGSFKIRPTYAGWALRTLAQTLNKAGFTTNWLPEDQPDSFNGPRTDFNPDDAWNITFGPRALIERMEPYYSWIQVRLETPVYGGKVVLKQFGPDIARALEAITDKHLTLTPAMSRMKVLVRPMGRPFEFQKLKRLVSLLYWADPVINEIHPLHCGPGSLGGVGLQYTQIARPLSYLDLALEIAVADAVEDPWNNRISMGRPKLLLLNHPGDLHAPKYGRIHNAIHTTKDMRQLVRLLGINYAHGDEVFSIQPFIAAYGIRAAYDFQQISEDNPDAWLQFNQHFSTLNTEAVTSWTALCACLVGLSLNKSKTDFHRTIFNLSLGLQEPQSITLPDFLRTCNQEAVADWYEHHYSDQSMPDLQAWPLLQRAVGEDESEPRAADILGMFEDPSGSEAFNDEGIQAPSERLCRRYLTFLGNRMEAWHNRGQPGLNSRYTVGMEFEMLFAVTEELLNPEALEQVIQNPEPEDPRIGIKDDTTEACELLAAVLEDTIGVPARPDCQGWFTGDYASEAKELRARGLSFDPNMLKYQRWSVLRDSSLSSAKGWRGYAGLGGMEIVSPILRDSPEGWEALLKVIVGLRKHMKVTTDRTCGLHINAGMGTTPMPFNFIKKLACACFLADRLIFSFCHPSRELECSYCRPLSKESNLAMELPKAGKRHRRMPTPPDFAMHFSAEDLTDDEMAVLKRIWMTTTVKDLHDSMTAHSHRSSVSFRRLGHIGADVELTEWCNGSVEFRYAENEMDPEQILRLGQVLLAVFRFADTASPQAWKDFSRNLSKCRDTWDYDLPVLKQFLIHIDLCEDYGYWESKVLSRRVEKEAFVSRRDEERAVYWGKYSTPVSSEVSQDGGDLEYTASTRCAIDQLQILPEVPAETVERLRTVVCHRSSRSRSKPRTIETKIRAIEPVANLKSRAQELLWDAGVTGKGARRQLTKLLNNPPRTGFSTGQEIRERLAELDLALGDEQGTSGATRRHPAETILRESFEAAFETKYTDESFQRLLRYKMRQINLEPATPEEIAAFLGEDEDAVDRNPPFIFDSLPFFNGPAVALHATKEEVEEFVGGEKKDEPVRKSAGGEKKNEPVKKLASSEKENKPVKKGKKKARKETPQ